MTREQAKREIDSLDYYLQNHTDDYGEESHTAMMMAIKALSALDKVIAYCKKSPSAILPEDVLSLIRGEDVEIETDYGYEKFEPKTGYWIHFASSDDCSECGWSTGKYISPSKYCPNCGARMIEPTESEG